jgi:protein-disulfide isomerase/uncharacterized membrane protein
MRRFRFLLKIFAASSAVGVLFALAASYIHFQLEQSGGSYTSFCNVSSQVNCDFVLTSMFAKILGIPLAWLAVLAHGALLALALSAIATREERRRLLLARIVVLGGIGSAIFSAYMAFVSFTVLETVCLMCTGLYAAAAGQLAVALLLPRAFAEAAGRPVRLFARNALPAAAAAMFVATVALGRFGWSESSSPAAAVGGSLAELREADAEFYDWYVAQPVSASPAARAPDGFEKAPVVIVEFSDFECAHCRRNRELIRDLEARHRDVLRVVHRHFPLDPACNEVVEQSIHPRACKAAEAAECAALQNRYGEMADILFENQERLFESNLENLASRAGLDIERFRACMASRETLAKIVADTRAGQALELTSTPTLFFNGRRVKGTLADAGKYDLAVMIEARMAAGDTPAGPPGVAETKQ